MLVAAQIYQEKISLELSKVWYDERYSYYFESGTQLYEPPNNNYDDHEFAIIQQKPMKEVTGNEPVLGLLSYHINPLTRIASRFGAINFDLDAHSLIVAKDIEQAVKEIFFKYNCNGMQWSVIVGNPVQRAYEKLCKKYNGRECGYYHRCCCLKDGSIHDKKDFEIMREDYLKNENN